MRTLALGLTIALASSAAGQSLASRVTSSDGTVQVVYPSRPDVCGDGRGTISNVFGHSGHHIESWNGSYMCVHGPARVVATVVGHEITRLRVYVGPRRDTTERTIETSAADAVSWLTTLATSGMDRVAESAIMPMVLADAPTPWTLLLRIARDDRRAVSVRRASLFWLGNGVSEHLGIADADGDNDDDEMRKQAVFALSQRPKNESVPELIEIARGAKNAAARRSAIFWLGQTGDLRAADVFAELLGSK